MIFGFLIDIAVLVLVVLGIRKLRSRTHQAGVPAQSVRRFFQYLILFGLLVVVAIGVVGLFSRFLNRSTTLIADQTELARDFSFLVVGLPLYVVVALWTRRAFLSDSREAKSFGWTLYFTLASITSLLFAMFALNSILSWGLGNSPYSGGAVAQFVVWGVLWGGHWFLDSRLTPTQNSRLHHIGGSLIGLIASVIGVAGIISGILERILHLGGDTLIISPTDPIVRGAITLAVGAPVWYLYWLRTVLHAERENLWFGYVLLAGVGGGLTMAIVSVSTVLYTTLVWLIGNPGTTDSSLHFRNFPSAAGYACVGAISWWYHRTIFHLDQKLERTEVQRVYEYLMAGIGLLASAGGIAVVLVALFEAITDSSVISSESSSNTLLAAATLLIVGSPVWWIYWRRIQAFAIIFPEQEHSSVSRRIYLFILFGIGGLTAIITLIVGVFFLFDDIFKGNFGSETLRRIRVPLGLLLSTGGIAGYHWSIYRLERDRFASLIRNPRFILLVGPEGSDIARQVAHRTGAKIQPWTTTGASSADWNAESISSALSECDSESVLVLGESGKIRVIPIERK